MLFQTTQETKTNLFLFYGCFLTASFVNSLKGEFEINSIFLFDQTLIYLKLGLTSFC